MLSFTGWIHKCLIKMYVDGCKELSEVPNIKVLKKLYNLEVRRDLSCINSFIATAHWQICHHIFRCWIEFVSFSLFFFLQLLLAYYCQQVSDDEIVVSDCDLQDLSITPLINALHSQKSFAMLDLSHNLLGTYIFFILFSGLWSFLL